MTCLLKEYFVGCLSAGIVILYGVWSLLSPGIHLSITISSDLLCELFSEITHRPCRAMGGGRSLWVPTVSTDPSLEKKNNYNDHFSFKGLAIPSLSLRQSEFPRQLAKILRSFRGQILCLGMLGLKKS